MNALNKLVKYKICFSVLRYFNFIFYYDSFAAKTKHIYINKLHKVDRAFESNGLKKK